MADEKEKQKQWATHAVWGNTGAKAAAPAKKPSPEEEIRDGVDYIQTVAGDLHTAIGLYFSFLESGLRNFETAMMDARFDKLEEKDNSEIISKALEVFVDIVFPEEKLAEVVAEKAAAALKEIAKAIAALSQVKGASGASTYHEFVVETIENASAKVQEQVKEIEGSRDKLKKAYQEAANANIAQGRLVLETFKAFQTNVTNSLKGWDPKKFEQLFAAEFAGRKGDTRQSTFRSYATGTLYFIVVMQRTPSGNGFTYEELSGPTWEKWTLVTKGSSKDAAGAAEALMESSPDKLPWKMNLPRRVKLELREKSNEGSRIASAWLIFNPGNTSEKFDAWEDLDNGYYGQTQNPLAELREAWSHLTVRAPAQGSQELDSNTKAPQ